MEASSTDISKEQALKHRQIKKQTKPNLLMRLQGVKTFSFGFVLILSFNLLINQNQIRTYHHRMFL